jgi:hypothetical protein
MVNVQKLKGSSFVSTAAVTVYENLNFAEHRGFFFFSGFAAPDVFNYTVEVLDTQAAAYKIVRNRNVSFTDMQSFNEQGIEMIPRVTDQIRIKFTKISGTDRTINYTMYAILVT